MTRKPEISPPILLATTFNPNDAEGHQPVLPSSARASNFIAASNETVIKKMKKGQHIVSVR